MKQAERRKFHYIYKIIRFDGKYYIGMHSTDDLEDGYFGSGQLLWKSIAKYGREKHSKEILEFLPTRQELKTRERELVNEEIVNDPFCMNLKLGGEGGGKFWSEEHQRKCASAGGKVGGKTAGKLRGRENILKFNQPGRPPTYGTLGRVWVTNGIVTKSVQKDMLDLHLTEGWRRGRK